MPLQSQLRPIVEGAGTAPSSRGEAEVTSILIPIPMGTRVPEALRERWAAAWSSSLEPASPFHHPRFAEAAARGRDDVALLVESAGSEPIRFLPMHRLSRRRAVALGGRLADAQGGVQSDGAPWDPSGPLRDHGVRSMGFSRFDGACQWPESALWGSAGSPMIDFSQGFEAYRAMKQAAGSGNLSQLLRKGRKLGREVGPLRLVFDSDDPSVLANLMEWKRSQRARTDSTDPFRDPWAVSLVADLRESPGPSVSAPVTALYAGEHLVAAHMGLASERRMHWWVPGYDQTFGAYSPGLVLLVELLRELERRGLHRLDLGLGKERYKASMATGTVPLFRGAFECSRLRSLVGRSGVRLRERIRHSRFEGSWDASKVVLRRIGLRG